MRELVNGVRGKSDKASAMLKEIQDAVKEVGCVGEVGQKVIKRVNKVKRVLEEVHKKIDEA